MDLATLKDYKGITPVPEDFDAYWDRVLKDLAAVKPEADFTLADFQLPNAECYDLYFTGVNGARIYAKHVRPKNVTGKVPAVFLYHGYTASSPEWCDLMQYPAAGFAVFAMDCRGQGGKSEDVGGVKGNTYQGHIIRGAFEDDPDKLLYRAIILDAVELIQIGAAQSYVDNGKLYTQGGSQGGGLALAGAALVPEVAKVSAMFPFLSDYKAQYEQRGFAFNELHDYFRMFDPRHERETELFTKLGYIDVKNLCPRVKAKVLMFTGLEDTAVPPAGHFAAYNNLNCEKKHILYPEYGHEALRGAGNTTLQFFLED